MIIFLLCIPLIIFIGAEGTVIYFLIKRITEALWEDGFSASTLIDDVTPSLTAIMYVLGLILFSGIIIWVYIRFVIISAFKKRKREKEENSGKNKNNEDDDNNHDNKSLFTEFTEKTEESDETEFNKRNKPSKKRKNKR